MTTPSVKGLLKGLRYISQMFDEKEGEDEIQIGFPTDVKHLSHIGCDDQSANAPSWMTEYKATPEPSAVAAKPTETLEGGKEVDKAKENKKSKGAKIRNIIPRSRHHSMDNQSLTNSPTQRSSEGSKHTRRRRSSDSSSESAASGGSRHSRQNRDSNQENESQPQEEKKPATATKHSRRKSKTGSSGGGEGDGSVTRSSRPRRSSKSKGDSLSDISFTDLGSGPENGHGSK